MRTPRIRNIAAAPVGVARRAVSEVIPGLAHDLLFGRGEVTFVRVIFARFDDSTESVSESDEENNAILIFIPE